MLRLIPGFISSAMGAQNAEVPQLSMKRLRVKLTELERPLWRKIRTGDDGTPWTIESATATAPLHAFAHNQRIQ